MRKHRLAPLRDRTPLSVVMGTVNHWTDVASAWGLTDLNTASVPLHGIDATTASIECRSSGVLLCYDSASFVLR